MTNFNHQRHSCRMDVLLSSPFRYLHQQLFRSPKALWSCAGCRICVVRTAGACSELEQTHVFFRAQPSFTHAAIAPVQNTTMSRIVETLVQSFYLHDHQKVLPGARALVPKCAGHIVLDLKGYRCPRLPKNCEPTLGNAQEK